MSDNRYKPYNLRSQSTRRRLSLSATSARIPGMFEASNDNISPLSPVERDGSRTPIRETASSDAQSPRLYSDVVASRPPSPDIRGEENTHDLVIGSDSISSLSSIESVALNLEPSIVDEGKPRRRWALDRSPPR